MGHNNYFQFKQFRINQEKSAMRVGTDGVLLGAWTDVSSAVNVLDVGTGTGLIAIMLAQRSMAKIMGVEIEVQAAIEAKQNAENSHWSSRITIHHLPFQEYAALTAERFDIIVSNPPYFTNAVKNKQTAKSLARHNYLLPFDELLQGISKILKEGGKLSLILPTIEAKEFTIKAKKYGFYQSRITDILPSVGKEPNRHLMEFSRKNERLIKNTLSIFEVNGSDYTTEYKNLTTDFYLNF